MRGGNVFRIDIFDSREAFKMVEKIIYANWLNPRGFNYLEEEMAPWRLAIEGFPSLKLLTIEIIRGGSSSLLTRDLMSYYQPRNLNWRPRWAGHRVSFDVDLLHSEGRTRLKNK